MINDIKKELKSIAKGILETPGYIESKGSMNIIENLYRKSVIYNFLDEKNKKNVQDAKQLNGIEKNTSADMTSKKTLEFIKKTTIEEKVPKSKKTINDLFSKDLNIGLNDRLAFIKNLFDSNEDDYQRVISQLSTFQNWDEANSFINEFIKPDYKYWRGKDVFEKRFLSLVKNFFL
tara:strand:- start:678 stop:1205 length:528 start_codon:yes stop_codon:yes gene_type:complete